MFLHLQIPWRPNLALRIRVGRPVHICAECTQEHNPKSMEWPWGNPVKQYVTNAPDQSKYTGTEGVGIGGDDFPIHL